MEFVEKQDDEICDDFSISEIEEIIPLFQDYETPTLTECPHCGKINKEKYLTWHCIQCHKQITCFLCYYPLTKEEVEGKLCNGCGYDQIEIEEFLFEKRIIKFSGLKSDSGKLFSNYNEYMNISEYKKETGNVLKFFLIPLIFAAIVEIIFLTLFL